jgi:uncharacterized protein (TIGR02246 family)
MRMTWFLAVVMFVAAPVSAGEPATQRGDAAAIRQLYARYDARWNEGDLTGLAMIWADDADHVEPDGRVVKGRAAIENQLRQRFASDLKGTRSQQTITGIRFITRDVAVVDASYEVTGARDAKGQGLPALQGRYVDIWVKRARKWYIVADRPIVFVPAAK